MTFFLSAHPRLRLAAVAVGLWLCAFQGAGPAQAAKEMTSLRVVVVDEAGAPVARASVVVSRLKGKNKNKIKGDPLQIKTSLQGAAPLPPLEQGYYMVQVISSGYQTSGEMIELEETEQEYSVVMKKPQGQFSVHTAK
ncbi:MAG: carboxypeptidase regulatory-like domain-containing protein [Acidobacteria bacterium]|nr:carboxypeptidase regulatory-like domain-containing protein [Acidobacteriota bacterium]